VPKNNYRTEFLFKIAFRLMSLIGYRRGVGYTHNQRRFSVNVPLYYLIVHHNLKNTFDLMV